MFPASVAMDGPFQDPCATIVAADANNTVCTEVGETAVGKGKDQVRVVIYLASPSAAEAKERTGVYRVGVKLGDGWYLSHDELDIVPYWREHGPSHVQHPRVPDLVPLALASGRPAIGVDIPIVVDVDDHNDQSRPANQPASRWTWPGSPVAMIACGARADGTWACLKPASTAMPHRPVIHFAPDGGIVPDRDDFRGYQVTASDRVSF